ncbi:hypothetical protein WJX79_009958, partial [Trebouxia sp. C0005]
QVALLLLLLIQHRRSSSTAAAVADPAQEVISVAEQLLHFSEYLCP